MREYLLTFLVTAAVTYLLTPLVRRGAVRAGALPAPRDRDVHVVPTPRWGGLAMYGGLAAGLLVATQLIPLNTVFSSTGPLNMETGLLLAGGLVVAMGVIDDRWGMNAISKLAGQVAAGAILVASGCELGWLPLPGGGTFSPTPNQAMVLTILVVAATINAVNFIDGLDGLAAGIVGIAAIAFFLYYYSLTHVLRLSAEAGPALASAVLAGMCIGFLPHNFFPARIFMGDTGSMLLGLLLAYAPISSISSLDPLTLTSQQAYRIGTVNRFPEILPLLLPLIILVIPYADMLMAVIRRTRAGMSPFAPDRKHLHHRLLDIGHSHRLSVLIMYLWAAMFSGLIVWLSIAKRPSWVFAAITVGAVLSLLLMSMPRLRWWGRQRRRELAAGAGPATVVAAGAAGTTAPAVGPFPSPVAAPVPADANVWERQTRPSPGPAAPPAPAPPRFREAPRFRGAPPDDLPPGVLAPDSVPPDSVPPADSMPPDSMPPESVPPDSFSSETGPADPVPTAPPASEPRQGLGPGQHGEPRQGLGPGQPGEPREPRQRQRQRQGQHRAAPGDGGLSAIRPPAGLGAQQLRLPRSVVGTIPPAVLADTALSDTSLSDTALSDTALSDTALSDAMPPIPSRDPEPDGDDGGPAGWPPLRH